jgi:hypothetical protein
MSEQDQRLMVCSNLYKLVKAKDKAEFKKIQTLFPNKTSKVMKKLKTVIIMKCNDSIPVSAINNVLYNTSNIIDNNNELYR